MEYISLSEAVSLTGKSERTIRRMIADFKNTDRVKKEGRKIVFDRALISRQTSRQDADMAEALKAHIETLKEQVADLQKRLDRKDMLLEQINHKLIALFEGRSAKQPIMRIMSSDAQETEVEDLPKDFDKGQFTDWIAHLSRKKA